MKARYTKIPDKRTKEVYLRSLQDMQNNYAVFFEKLFIYKLHTEFGFGHKRLNDMINSVAKAVDEMQDDPTFWDKVDRDVIDILGFNYSRCDYEKLEQIFYKPPEIKMDEKRKDLATFAKMQEWVKNNGT